MADERKRDGRGCATLIAIGLVVAPILYLLSVGPAYWAWKAGHLPDGTIGTLYFPIMWLARQVPYVDAALTSYVLLWVPEL